VLFRIQQYAVIPVIGLSRYNKDNKQPIPAGHSCLDIQHDYDRFSIK